MKIGILSRQPRSYSTRRLREAAAGRGHRVQVLDTLRFSISLEQERPGLHYRQRRLGALDAVIPRIGAGITFFGLAVLRQFEMMGVYTANDSMAIARSRDKLRAIQLLSRYDIGIPATEFVRDSDDIIPAIRRVGGVPVILKVLEGTQGVGVILAESEKMAEAIIQTLHSARQNILIQNFVRESEGRDLRALVVGDRVVAAMRRMARPGEFRSNVHRGAKVEAVDLPPEYERTALRAAQIMGLRVAGVDMLETSAGPQVLEVNSSPGFEGLEQATGIDVAGAVIEDIERNVLSPEMELRQRLRLPGGYGIAELHVHQMPALEHHTLREIDLAARNIQVMSITRHDGVLSNPSIDETILPGDRVLCYGELLELRNLMGGGKKRRRRRRPPPGDAQGGEPTGSA